MTARSILDKDTSVNRVGRLCHADLDILDRGGLRGGPMDSLETRCWCNSSAIDDQVADLAQEQVG